MQPSQVKQHFRSVELTIERAAQLCQTNSKVPEPIRESLGQLSRESHEALQVLANEKNDNRIVQCVDHLEKLGDRAWHACAQAGNNVDEQVKAAVKEAHDALSDLKHRLH